MSGYMQAYITTLCPPISCNAFSMHIISYDALHTTYLIMFFFYVILFVMIPSNLID